MLLHAHCIFMGNEMYSYRLLSVAFKEGLDCLLLLFAGVCPPDRLTVDPGPEDNSLAVTLFRPQCSFPHGYIDHYVILYCQYDGQGNCSHGGIDIVYMYIKPLCQCITGSLTKIWLSAKAQAILPGQPIQV